MIVSELAPHLLLCVVLCVFVWVSIQLLHHLIGLHLGVFGFLSLCKLSWCALDKNVWDSCLLNDVFTLFDLLLLGSFLVSGIFLPDWNGKDILAVKHRTAEQRLVNAIVLLCDDVLSKSEARGIRKESSEVVLIKGSSWIELLLLVD